MSSRRVWRRGLAASIFTQNVRDFSALRVRHQAAPALRFRWLRPEWFPCGDRSCGSHDPPRRSRFSVHHLNVTAPSRLSRRRTQIRATGAVVSTAASRTRQVNARSGRVRVMQLRLSQLRWGTGTDEGSTTSTVGGGTGGGGMVHCRRGCSGRWVQQAYSSFWMRRWRTGNHQCRDHGRVRTAAIPHPLNERNRSIAGKGSEHIVALPALASRAYRAARATGPG